MFGTVAIVNNTELHTWKLPKEQSWPLENMGFNYMSPLTHRLFFLQKILQYYTVCSWEQPWIQEVKYKLHVDFQLHRGLVPLMPTLFKGQLRGLKSPHHKKKKMKLCMVMDINYIYYGDHFAMYTNIDSFCTNDI